MKTALVKFEAIEPKTAEQLEKLLLQLAERTSSENGLKFYEIFKGEENNTIYYVRESWETDEHFNEHLNQPHLQKFVDEVTLLLKEQFSFTRILTVKSIVKN